MLALICGKYISTKMLKHAMKRNNRASNYPIVHTVIYIEGALLTTCIL